MNIVKGIITGLGFDNDLPSGRILFALEAMRHFEQTDGMEINMSAYRMRGISSDICYACCGGAARSVMEGWTTPDTFVTEQVEMCEILDYEKSLDLARRGDIDAMFDLMGMGYEDGDHFCRVVAVYHDYPEQFYTEMTDLANELQAAGY